MTGSINEINALTAKGKGVRGMFGSKEGLHEEAFEEWKTSSQDFLMEQLGEDSQFYKDFASRVTNASLSCCSTGIGVLIAARKSLEDAGPAEHAKPVESLEPAMAAAPPEEPQIEPPQPERPEPVMDFPQKLDSLIAMGKGVRDKFGTASGVSKEAFEEWRACSHQFLSEEFGQDNLFFQDFASKVNEATLVACNIGIGILLAVKRSQEESRVKRAGAPVVTTQATEPQVTPEAEAPPAPATEEEKEPVEEAAPPEQFHLVTEEAPERERATVTEPAKPEPEVEKPAPPEAKEERAETPKEAVAPSAEEPQPLPPVPIVERPPTPPAEEEKEPVEEAALPEQPPVVAKKTSKRGRSVAATQKPGAKLKKKKPARPVTKEEKAETPKGPEQFHLVTEEAPERERATVIEPAKPEPEVEKPAAPSPEVPGVSMNTVEVLENLWWQAQVQLSQGHKDAAAVLCGGVCEVVLRYLCAVHNIPVKEWDTIGDLNDKLLDNGVYDDSTHKKFVSWWYLREDALAANYDAYNKNDVASMLRGVEGVLKQHLS
ncbi:MAG: hypothetical protein GY800_11275 [Planctomycetes bacterium]|nr:hypothetical protein [Planctomycetota bacterium]